MEDLLSLIGPQIKAGDVGGLRIQFSGRLGEVNVIGGLENRQEGYSALMPFWRASMPPMDGMGDAPVTLGHPGIMVGAPDPLMGFPSGTRFLPYLALRNVTAHRVTVNPVFYTEQGTALPIPAQTLQSGESRQVDMTGTLRQLGLQSFNGALTLATTHAGQATDVLVAAGSVDASGTYVFEVEARGVEQRVSKQTPYWSLQSGNNAMISLWNPSNQPEDIVATLHYAQGSGHYNFKVHLAARATANFDILELVTDQAADADGNLIPREVLEGSLVFHGAAGLTQRITLNVAVAIFNVVKGTCYWGYVYCDGYTALTVTPSTFTVNAAQTQQLKALGNYDDGTTDDVTGQASWTSNNNSLATVQSGLVSGVTAGTIVISASDTLPAAGEYYGYDPTCDGLQPDNTFTGGVTGTVYDPSPTINLVSPSSYTVGSFASVQISGANFGTTSCPVLTFPFALQGGYSATNCKDSSLNVTFTPAAPGSGNLTLTSQGFGGQPFQRVPGAPPPTAQTTISATSPPPPSIASLQGLLSGNQWVTPFSPSAGTPQGTTQYLVIWGSGLAPNVSTPPKICLNGTNCSTGGGISVTGFHLGGSWIISTYLNQVNIPYWVDPTATAGTYTLTAQTANGTSAPPTTFVVLPPPVVQVTPGPITIMATTTGPDIRQPIANSALVMASGQPSGGTFNWSTTSPLVTLTNSESQTVTVTSVLGGYSHKSGDAVVEVVYTLGGASSLPATSTLTVSKPQTLIIKTDSTNNTGHGCNQGSGPFTQSQSYYPDTLIGAHYTSYLRNRTYAIQDYLGNTVNLSMNLFESYSPIESQISVGAGVGATATDFFAFCSQTCRTGGAATITSNQSIYANNFPIAYKAVSWTCSAVTVIP